MTSKTHFCIHSVHLSKNIHPSLVWCYKGETMMKFVQRLWKSCLAGNKHWNVGRVAALKFRHQLHLKSWRKMSGCISLKVWLVFELCVNYMRNLAMWDVQHVLDICICCTWDWKAVSGCWHVSQIFLEFCLETLPNTKGFLMNFLYCFYASLCFSNLACNLNII